METRSQGFSLFVKWNKMAASFKIPTSLKRKAEKDPELPKFEWKLFEKENKLGCGTFWSVYLAKYKGKIRKSGCQKQ
jgi:hypothetical protein